MGGDRDLDDATATITLPEGGDVTCTFTNTRRTATLTLQKTWIDGATGDTANLDITSLDPATATATATGAPGEETSPNPATTTVFAGETITLTETLDTTANPGTYDTTLECDQPGLDYTPGDLTGTLTIPDHPHPHHVHVFECAAVGGVVVGEGVGGWVAGDSASLSIDGVNNDSDVAVVGWGGWPRWGCRRRRCSRVRRCGWRRWWVGLVRMTLI